VTNESSGENLVWHARGAAPRQVSADCVRAAACELVFKNYRDGQMFSSTSSGLGIIVASDGRAKTTRINNNNHHHRRMNTFAGRQAAALARLWQSAIIFGREQSARHTTTREPRVARDKTRKPNSRPRSLALRTLVGNRQSAIGQPASQPPRLSIQLDFQLEINQLRPGRHIRARTLIHEHKGPPCT
jgi:hypothetical protein